MDRRDARFEALREGIVRPGSIPDDAIKRVLLVPPELAGARLDRFLQGQLRGTSRTRSQLIISRSAFTPEGTPLKKNHRVRGGERVVLWRDIYDDVSPEILLETVFEDEHLLALNKPPSLPVHPSARHHRSTVTMLLSEQRPEEHLTLIHRLDRETSGVLLLARTRAADRLVKIQFEKREGVIKQYVAISWGRPTWEHMRCEHPIEPDPVSPYRVKMRVAEAGCGQASATSFEVLGRRSGAEGRDYTLLRCTLHSGRQHQIRVHLASLRLPIVGDKLYGPDASAFARGVDGELTEEDLAMLEMERQALHAHVVEIEHPVSGERLRIEAPLYEDMATFWDDLAGI
jgi:23S rRNA pseudouridine1911/1915/1917 synthase